MALIILATIGAFLMLLISIPGVIIVETTYYIKKHPLIVILFLLLFIGCEKAPDIKCYDCLVKQKDNGIEYHAEFKGTDEQLNLFVSNNNLEISCTVKDE